jgi:hypothetical protein
MAIYPVLLDPYFRRKRKAKIKPDFTFEMKTIFLPFSGGSPGGDDTVR